MSNYTYYIYKGLRECTWALLLVILASCTDRRDLWVMADEYRQLELVTDWSEADDYPGGMTAWFIDNDGSGYTRNFKTAEVEHTWLGLPRGNYMGMVFDYSPEEYSHNEFVTLDNRDSAMLKLRPAANQPVLGDTVNEALFGDIAVPEPMKGLERNPNTGFYVVKAEPDPINLDVLGDVEVITGTEGDYVLWRKRAEYESSLVTQTLYAQPKPITWRLHVLVNVKGIIYMHSLRASVVGLADGYLMGQGMHSEEVCIQSLDDWSVNVTGENEGNVTTSTLTFGLPEDVTATREEIHQFINNVRLNRSFLLRDEVTVKNYHFDCVPYVSIYEDQLVVSVVIPIDVAPELPYVNAKGGTGFDANVTPWENGGSAEATM